MSFQDELNRLASTTNRTCKDCANILAGTTANPTSTQIAIAVYASQSNISTETQVSMNKKAIVTGLNLSKQDAAKLL